MSTATLTRRPRGLDPGVNERRPGPCLDEPARWDIDRSNGPFVGGLIAAAVAECHRCPLLALCDRTAVADPPEHTCVVAARVWDGGQPFEPAAWLAGARPTPVDRRRECARPDCGALFAPHSSHHLYCSAACVDAAKADSNLRHQRRRRATGGR
jgi:hypothetical protein